MVTAGISKAGRYKDMGKQIRLDKYLADMSVGTRSEVKKYIRNGRILVDGRVVKTPESKVDPEASQVLWDNHPVTYEEQVYYMLHKPAGVITATEDPRQSTVLDLITDKKRKDLFPVGRLDKDTTGLLLITNDGQLAHDLLAPGRHVDKVYEAVIDGCVTEKDAALFEAGLVVDEEFTALPARLTILSAGPISRVRIVIREGKYHQIKRMFEAVGKEVTALKRLQMGPLVLDEALEPGQYRRLTEAEIAALRGGRQA